jgi:hypothetical protein
MSLSAILLLAAATAAPVQDDGAPRGVVLAQARVTAQILPAAIVRQTGGLQQDGDTAPRHQLRRRGNTILVEFQ